MIDHVFHYGTPGDIPITGDWHGTGVHTIGLFYKGHWILDDNGDGRATDADHDFFYGAEGDLPVVGDFNGDGIDELGVYRKGTWYIDTNNDRVLDVHDEHFQLGGPHDVPVVGDWNGDGIDEPGIYHEVRADKRGRGAGGTRRCRRRSNRGPSRSARRAAIKFARSR